MVNNVNDTDAATPSTTEIHLPFSFLQNELKQAGLEKVEITSQLAELASERSEAKSALCEVKQLESAAREEVNKLNAQLKEVWLKSMEGWNSVCVLTYLVCTLEEFLNRISHFVYKNPSHQCRTCIIFVFITTIYLVDGVEEDTTTN